MDYRKIIDKVEHDLSHFLIDELTKDDPTKRMSYDLYKYKGLSILADPRSKAHDKTIKVRIGVLEAEFKISDGTKCSGSFAPHEEKLISMWLGRSENSALLRRIFADYTEKREVPIVPFGLEDVFEESSD